MLQVEIAGLTLAFDTRYASYMREMLSGYCRTEPSPAVLKLDAEPWIDSITAETEQEPETVEFYAFSAALGEKLPLFDRLQTHGVAIEFGGKAYVFSAPSGTGKSTRAFLWQKYLGPDRDNTVVPELVPKDRVAGIMTVLWRGERQVKLDSVQYRLYIILRLRLPFLFKIFKSTIWRQ